MSLQLRLRPSLPKSELLYDETTGERLDVVSVVDGKTSGRGGKSMRGRPASQPAGKGQGVDQLTIYYR
jgi:hypothetical protein